MCFVFDFFALVVTCDAHITQNVTLNQLNEVFMCVNHDVLQQPQYFNLEVISALTEYLLESVNEVEVSTADKFGANCLTVTDQYSKNLDALHGCRFFKHS